MESWVPIKYMGYWDVPRIFLVRHDGQCFLYHSPFDPELDDYPEEYAVYLMPHLRDDQLPQDWTTLHRMAIRYLGKVPIAAVRFDPTRMEAVEESSLAGWSVGSSVAS